MTFIYSEYQVLRTARKEAFKIFLSDRTRENLEAYNVARKNQLQYSREEDDSTTKINFKNLIKL
jgi:hypothetical protein